MFAEARTDTTGTASVLSRVRLVGSDILHRIRVRFRNDLLV